MNEKLLDQLIQEGVSKILDGLPSEQYAEAKSGLSHLLRIDIEPTFKGSTPKVDEIAARIGRRVIDEIAKTPPEKRLEYIQLEILSNEIGNLDWDCREIAEKSIEASPDMPTLQGQAKKNLEKVEEYYRLLEEKGPFWEREFGRNLSEAHLDCRFVLGLTEHSSLRLGRTIQILQQHGSWPPDWYRQIWMKEK